MTTTTTTPTPTTATSSVGKLQSARRPTDQTGRPTQPSAAGRRQQIPKTNCPNMLKALLIAVVCCACAPDKSALRMTPSVAASASVASGSGSPFGGHNSLSSAKRLHPFTHFVPYICVDSKKETHPCGACSPPMLSCPFDAFRRRQPAGRSRCRRRVPGDARHPCAAVSRLCAEADPELCLHRTLCQLSAGCCAQIIGIRILV